ncbi:MAG: MBG domain-containing protein [Verrucomicrobiia bacterium]
MATAILLSAAGARGDVLEFDLQLPVSISGGDPSETVLSSLPALQAASLEAVKITLMHEWLGDLTVKVISPNGAEVVLFDRVGAGSDGSSAILGRIQDSQPGSPVFSLVPQEYQFAEAGESFPNAAEAAVGTQILPVVPGDAVYASQSWAFGTFTAGVWQLVVTDAAALSGGEIVNAELHYTPGTADPAVVTLFWQQPAEIIYGSALGSSELSATAMCGGVAVPGTFTYSPPAGTVLPAGAGQLLSVQFTPTDRSRFASAQGSVQITVRPANLVVTPRNATKPYGAPLPEFGVDYEGFVNGDDPICLTPAVEVGTSATAESPVGQYPITVVLGASPNYTIIPQAGTLSITKAALTVRAVNESMVYGAQLPSLTATYSGFVGNDSPASLTEPVTLSTYASATSPPGTYPILVTGGASPNYTLVLESGTMTVTKAPLTVRAENKSKLYGAQLPAFTATYSGFVGTDSPANLTEPVTLSTSATPTSPPGTYPIMVTGGASPKYDLVRENGVLTVSSKPVLTIRAENKSKLYGAPLPSLTATYTGFVGTDNPASLTEPITLSTSATATSPPGTYPIVVTGGASPNYTLVLENGTLTVTKAALTVRANNKSKLYGAQLPAFTATYTGFVGTDSPASLTEPITLSTSATATSPPGTYPIVVTGGASPNYTLVLENGTLTVTKAALTVRADNKSKLYGAQLPAFTATYTGFVGTDNPASLTEPITLSTSATATSPPGTYPIVVTGGASPNYTLVLENGTLTVTKAALTVRADNKSKLYGAPLPSLTATYTGFVGNDTPASLTEPVTLSTSATPTSPPGTYPIVVTGGASPKYDLVRENGVLTVSSKPVLTIRAENKSKVYGAPLPSLTAIYTGFVGTDNPASLTEPITLSTSATATSPPGTYPIVVTGGASPNYTLVLENGTLTVTKAALTVRADNKSKLYGAQLPAFTATYSGFVGTDSPANLTEPVTLSTSATPTSPPGTYPIVVTGGASPKYDLVRENGVLTVSSKPVLTIRAENKSKVYGAPLPSLTATYTGFVGTDNPASLTEPITLSTSATATSPPGTYPIVVTGGASPNYTLVLENGTLTVTKAALTVRAENKSKVYGAPLPSLTATYTGFVGTDNPANLTEPVTLSTSATATSPPGTYPIVVTGGASPNYTLVLENGTLTVTKAALTVRADNKSKLYGAQLPAFTATYSGFVGNDNPASLTEPITLSTSATPTSPPGTYPIVVTGGASPKYDLVRENGVLTVSSKPVLTIRAENKSKVYGAPLPSLTATYTGFVGTDNPASLTEPVTLSTSATATSPPGTYPIVVTGGASPNYTLVLENGTLTVTKAALTVRADNKSKLYGAQLPAFTATYSGFVGTDSPANLTEPVTLSTSATPTSPPGTYPIVVTGGASPKYDLVRENGVLTVSSKPVLTIRADNKSKLYGAPLPSLTATYTGFVGTDNPASLTEPITLSTSATATSPPGTYPIVVTGGASPNYTLVLENGTLTVTKAALTVRANNKSKLYGAQLPAFTATYTGFVGTDSPASLTEPITLSTSATATSPPGTYPIVVTGGASPNYTLVLENGTLTVTKAALTVRADNKSKLYGAPLPSLTATYTGFVGNDTPASLTEPVTLSTSATPTSPPGTYPIVVTGGASPKYDLVRENGVLTVSSKPVLTIRAENKSKVYGAPLPSLTAIYTGFVGTDNPASLTEPITLSTSATATSPPGTYPIVVTGGASPNYTLVLESGTMTITKAPLTVVAEDKTKSYGVALPQFTASYSGFVRGDTPDCLDEPVTFTTSATVNSPVGSYSIDASGGADGNYTLQFVRGKLTIGRAPLTITGDPKTKVYGAPVPELTATYRGFVNGDTMAVVTAPPSLSTAVTANSAPGAYQIRVSGGVSPMNYTLVLNNGVLTVTKAPLTITAEDKRMEPGMAVPNLTARYSGFAEGEGPGSLSQALKLTTTADSSSPPGNYPILPSGAASPNYEISFVPGTLTIGDEHSPPVLTVTSPNDPQGRIVRIPVGASPGCQVRLEWSEDLVSWSEAVVQTCTDNQVVFEIEIPSGANRRFFRAAICD